MGVLSSKSFQKILKIKQMKKLLLVFAVSAFFVACNDAGTSTDTTTDSTTVTTTTDSALVPATTDSAAVSTDSTTTTTTTVTDSAK